jgi:hypothetical protein
MQLLDTTQFTAVSNSNMAEATLAPNALGRCKDVR